MEFYLSLLTLFGFRILLGLSAYVVILTGQISLAQAGFYALGAYTAGAASSMWGWPIFPAILLGGLVGGLFGLLVGFPALRVRGLFLVIATLAFTEIVRMVFLNLKYTIRIGDRTSVLCTSAHDGGSISGGIRGRREGAPRVDTMCALADRARQSQSPLRQSKPELPVTQHELVTHDASAGRIRARRGCAMDDLERGTASRKHRAAHRRRDARRPGRSPET